MPNFSIRARPLKSRSLPNEGVIRRGGKKRTWMKPYRPYCSALPPQARMHILLAGKLWPCLQCERGVCGRWGWVDNLLVAQHILEKLLLVSRIIG